ncbi:MAG: beta-lactamase family protein [Deltaproteobacteria bacterium]|nr:beta-lactamase family protein [Deltaproteobacteria bacterium]
MRYQTKKQKIENLVLQSIENQTFPCVELFLAQGNEVIYHEVFGRIEKYPDSDKLPKNALFDLASITKALATASAVLLLIEQGRLFLEERVVEFIPEFSREDTKKITIKQLLTHNSGLPAWARLYDENFDFKKGFQKLLSTALINEPGKEIVYSCLGYLLLGEIIRRVSKSSLSEFCATNLFLPLGLNHLLFKPDPLDKNLVSTSYCPLRQIMLKGIVHDENAYLFNQEGGNAGLFGTVSDVYHFCRMLMNGGELNGERIFSELSVQLMFKNHSPKTLAPRAIGWDINSPFSNYQSCGDLMPVGSFGHLGFTGTSLWFDPVSKIVVQVLSNRVHFQDTDNKNKIMEFRPKIHNLLLSLI